ncbi:MAG TPA: 3-deoxy-D-manno-octulosonic acid transferase [Pyrinomonadaceae bacterium]|jgi:3-deoxy-D-manno-octulosonic-acid transferase|nr:3-deoxy-D-manno-octulosonic acid transferase [Pyrinomonadaceae bacterium]
MYLLYSLLLTLGVVALMPRFIYDAFRHGKYVKGLRERMGTLPAIVTGGRPVIWLHCVSVGETQAARPLALALLERFQGHALVVSTTTLTGQQVAREVFQERANAVFYFPFDWSWSTRRALRAVNPSAVLIMETELWPNFLRECRARGIPVALVNGRLSENSFRRYKLIRGFMRRVVDSLSLALMQTEADAARLLALGLRPERVLVSGNVKFDGGTNPSEQVLTMEFKKRFGFDDGRPLIVAASTHAPEERIIIAAFKELQSSLGPTCARLLLAPRHPERFAEAATLLDASGLAWARRSHALAPEDAARDVILLDSIGELRAVYLLASIVFVGGSIARTGGHNVLEPAAAGACVLTGHHTYNFAAITKAFIEAHALLQLPAVTESEAAPVLAHALEELLTDDEWRRGFGERARIVLEQNRGATQRTIEQLTAILSSSSPAQGALDQSPSARPDALNA